MMNKKTVIKLMVLVVVSMTIGYITGDILFKIYPVEVKTDF